MTETRTARALYGAIVVLATTAIHAAEPINLAPRATVSASSEFSNEFRAEMAIGGAVPSEFLQDDDWAVKATQTGWFTLEWDKPVEAAQIIYYARRTSALLESFKDYEVYLNDEEKPTVRGALEHRRGPQRIDFPKRQVTKIRIEFLSSHPTSPNPGAAEIAVFASPVTEKQLAAMRIPPQEKTLEARALRRELLDGKLGFTDILLVKRKPLDISHVYVYHVEGFRPGGGLYVFSPNESGGQLKCIFDAGEGMITTADLSYDGKEVVFAMRRGGHVGSNPVAHIEDISRYADEASNYHVFTINIDGTGLKQLTRGTFNNLDPCWLPDGGIAFISDRKPAYAYCYVVTSPVVYRMKADGTDQKRLSANYLMDFTPSVLNDGRIVFTRWEYVDRAACPIQSLWAINPDGTGLSGFFGNRVLAPGTFMDAQPVPGTNKIVATATNHNGPCRGGIVLIDPTKGANSKEAITNLTPEIELYGISGVYGNGLRGPYEKPFAVGNNKFLVANNGAVQLRGFDTTAITLLFPQDGMGYYSAQPIRKTPPPPVVAGATMDRLAVLPEDGSVSGAWATVFMRDVYHGLEPHVKRGEIKQIAVVQELEKSTHSPQNNLTPDGKRMRNVAVFGFQFPVVSCGATYAPKKLWGFADVDENGAAAFKVPAEVPIYFMALDAEGRALQRMRSFTHMMPGEVQGCVGCHADRNAAVSRPASRAGMRGTPQELIPPEWGVVGFSYPAVVQPVLDRNCIECHNERTQPNGVDLTGDKTDFFNVSYDVLARTGTQSENGWIHHGSPVGPGGDAVRGMSPYAEWIWTINGSGHNVLEIAPRRWGSPASLLADIIRTGHPDQDGKPRVNVPDADRRRVYNWLDLNVPYYGTSSSNHKRHLGSRRMMPEDLDATLNEIASGRCVECHENGVPRKFYTRMLKPERNNFMLAPLAKSAGGTEACGKAVFADKGDDDYQKLLSVFVPVQNLLRDRPRADMPGFVMPPCSTLSDAPLSAVLPDEK
ncbi:MAG: PD40 domain-containing protein [Pirellulales bacterium]|nr:PD40 domain-containing protein [Pirellulales bacterium]